MKWTSIRRPALVIAGLIALAIVIWPELAFAAGDEKSALQTSAEKFLPILILLVVVAFVLYRLPKVEGLGHTNDYRRRRVLNWLPLGLTYAFLYMGRYNLTVAKKAFSNMPDAAGDAMMSNTDFGVIFGVGTIVYGFSFLINGPLTDRFGGKFSILMGAGGSAVMNLVMGLCALSLLHLGPMSAFIGENFVLVFSILYAMNMYFQSFGAVAIVKVNAPWFHVRERGVFGAIFGILISLGVYFAFDVGGIILKIGQTTDGGIGNGLALVFLVPAVLLVIFWVLDLVYVRNTPGGAGHRDFDPGDAQSEDEDGKREPVVAIFVRMLKNPIILTIALIEFCSGFLRQAIMQWYQAFAKQTNGVLELRDSFVNENWGMLLCCAGIMGGVMAGIISDRVFGSRRGPVAVLLYALMLIGGTVMIFAYETPIVGMLVIVMSMAIIGVHGMLSGTASMDFGGRNNTGIAVGIIDGFVYLGTAVMSLTYAFLLPKEELAQKTDAAGTGLVDRFGRPVMEIVGPATDPDNWVAWPISMVVVAVVGVLLARRVWHASPERMRKKQAPA